ncbi:MAG: hypothetical protein C0404_02145 [Verrucomicrobia bacterium]|nr:hypothetical protein [Verrucomicrobiota bacterium]
MEQNDPAAVRPDGCCRGRRRVFIWVGSILCFLGVLYVVVAELWDARATKRYQAILAGIRASGEPVTPDEMVAKYRPTSFTTNAASYYRAAGMILLPSQGGVDEMLRDALPFVGTGSTVEFNIPLTPETLRLAETYLERKQTALDLITTAADLETTVFDLDWSKDFEMPMPHCGELRLMARTLRLKNAVDIARDDRVNAIQDVLRTFKLASSLKHEPNLLSGLIRLTIFISGIPEMERTFTFIQLSNAELRKIGDVIDSVADQDYLRRAFVGERVMAIALFERFDECPCRVREALQSTKRSDKWKVVLLARVEGWRKDQQSEHLLMIQDMIDAAGKPPRQRLDRMKQVGKKCDEVCRHNLITDRVTHACYAAAVRFVGLDQSLLLAKAATCVEMYRNDNGKLPATLEELVPKYMEAVPEDFFWDGKIKYKQDEPGYRLWSVGRNGKDDGGSTSNTTDHGTADIVFRVGR